MAKRSLSGSDKKSSRRKGKSWPFKEGDWFAVPLEPRAAGFGIGRAARVSPSEGIIFGYFFALRFQSIPSLQELQSLKPEQAIWHKSFGPMGLLEGEWPIIGQAGEWLRENWPMPWLVHRDVDTQRPDRLTRYDDGDPLMAVEEIFIHGSASDEEIAPYENLPEDGLAGHVYVERVLSVKIAEVERRQRGG
jgi:hypothetical protein